MNDRARDPPSLESRGGHSSRLSGSQGRRPYPLKNRIKNMMARSSALARVDEDSVFDAAKTLASISLASPAPSFASGGECGQASRQSSPELHRDATPAARSSAPASAEAPRRNQLDVPSLVWPSPGLGVALEDLRAGSASGVAAPPRGLGSSAAAAPPPPREGSISEPLPAWVGGDVPQTFPQKLMDILSNAQVSDIVTWLPHGKGFLILQKRRFAAEVMPLYFKHSKFTSFTRKLNRWGFTRVSKGPEMGAYYHKHFQRDDYHLCMQMRCNSISSQLPSSKASKKDTVAKTRMGGKPPRTPSPKPKVKTPPPTNSCCLSAMSDMDFQELNENIQSPQSTLHAPLPSPPSAHEHEDNPSPMSGQGSVTSAHDCERVPLTSGLERRRREILPGAFDHVFRWQQDEGTGNFHNLHDAGQFREGRGPPFAQFPSLLTQAGTFTGQHSSRHHLRQQLRQARQQLQQLQQRRQQQQHLREKQELHHHHHQQIQQQQRLHPPSQRQQEGGAAIYPEQPQTMAAQKLMGVDKTLSRDHPLVIANAMNALKSLSDSNDQVLLTAFMGDDAPAGGELGRLPSSEVRRQARASMQEQVRQREEDGIKGDGSLPFRARNIIYADMLAQIRHARKQDHEQPTSTRPSLDSSSPRAWDTSVILPQMSRLDESNHKQLVGMANKLPHAGALMSQSRIAQLHNEIECQMRQQLQQLHRQDGVPDVSSSRPGGLGELLTERTIPRVVRRASAA